MFKLIYWKGVRMKINCSSHGEGCENKEIFRIEFQILKCFK